MYVGAINKSGLVSQGDICTPRMLLDVSVVSISNGSGDVLVNVI